MLKELNGYVDKWGDVTFYRYEFPKGLRSEFDRDICSHIETRARVQNTCAHRRKLETTYGAALINTATSCVSVSLCFRCFELNEKSDDILSSIVSYRGMRASNVTQ